MVSRHRPGQEDPAARIVLFADLSFALRQQQDFFDRQLSPPAGEAFSTGKKAGNNRHTSSQHANMHRCVR